jgi:ribosome assembly protein 4
MPSKSKRPAEEEPEELVQIQFESQETQEISQIYQIPNTSTPKQLDLLLNSIYHQDLNYSYFINEQEIQTQLRNIESSVERVIKITYLPQAIFKVRTVTRCSTTLSGHTEAILNLLFSPDGKSLASASGDTTVRVWNLLTESPRYTLKSHSNWVQNLAWSPDCRWLVSGGMDSNLLLWDAEKGIEIGKMVGHKAPITDVCFEPLHLNQNLIRMVLGSITIRYPRIV